MRSGPHGQRSVISFQVNVKGDTQTPNNGSLIITDGFSESQRMFPEFGGESTSHGWKSSRVSS